MKGSKTLALLPTDVRARARKIKRCREINKSKLPASPNQKQKQRQKDENEIMLSFIVSPPSNDLVENTARVNVYCKTGTVGTCRVMNNEVREIFRQKCSLSAVERILNNPPELVSITGEHLIYSDDISGDNDKNNDEDDDASVPVSPIRSQENEETKLLRKDAELADVGIAVLLAETEKLTSHLKIIQANETCDENNDVNKKGSNNNGGGGGGGRRRKPEKEPTLSPKEYAFSLPTHTISHVEGCLADCSKTNDSIMCIATNGPGSMFLYRSGEWAYTADVPRALRNKLKGRQRSLAPPKYVALGTRGRYYISFEDGKAEWEGPKSLNECLREASSSSQKVSSVAFGGKLDTYFIVFEDGSWEYEGSDIPDGLEEILEDREDRDDLVCVTLGPNDEWFLKAKNGKMWWGGVSNELDDVFDEMAEGKKKLNFVDFGEYGSYFMSYE